jgi:hypothetical protein
LQSKAEGFYKIGAGGFEPPSLVPKLGENKKSRSEERLFLIVTTISVGFSGAWLRLIRRSQFSGFFAERRLLMIA